MSQHGDDVFLNGFGGTMKLSANVNNFVKFHGCEVHEVLTFGNFTFFKEIYFGAHPV